MAAIPTETESCSNPLVWPITKMCLRRICLACGGGATESAAGGFWAHVKPTKISKDRMSDRGFPVWRVGAPSKALVREAASHGEVLGMANDATGFAGRLLSHWVTARYRTPELPHRLESRFTNSGY